MTITKVTRNRYVTSATGIPEVYPNHERTVAGQDLHTRDHEQDLQHYHLPLSRLHHLALHDWGIACGLTVTGIKGNQVVRIEPGVAVDASGQLIVLANDGMAYTGDTLPEYGHHDETQVLRKPFLMALPPTGHPQTLYLTMQFLELLQPEVDTIADKLEQAPWLRWQRPAEYNADGTALVLAVVTTSVDGAIASLQAGDGQVSRRLLRSAFEELQIHRSQATVTIVDGHEQFAVQTAPPAGKVQARPQGGLRLSVPASSDGIEMTCEGGGAIAGLALNAQAVTCTGALTVDHDLTVKGKIKGGNFADADAFKQHVESKNAHNISAEIIGALPISGGVVTGSLGINGNLIVQGKVNLRDIAYDGIQLDNHIGNKTNPHGVTPQQIGALSLSGGTLTGALQVQGTLTTSGTVNGRNLASDGVNLDKHMADKVNPHGVTAQQVGALPVAGGGIGGSLGIGVAAPGAVGLEVRANGGRIAGNGLFFWQSGNYTDNLPFARLIEAWGMRFTSPDSRWVLSSGPSILVGYQPDGRNWGNGNLLISGAVGIGTLDLGKNSLKVEGGDTSLSGALIVEDKLDTSNLANQLDPGKRWARVGVMPRKTDGNFGWNIDNAFGTLVQHDSDYAFFGVKHEGGNRSDAIIAWGDDSEDSLKFVFGSSAARKPIEHMRITSDGRVGIGKSDPLYKLTVSDTIYSAKDLQPNSNPAPALNTTVSAANAKLLLYKYSEENWAGIGVDTGGGIWIRTGTSNNSRNLIRIGEGIDAIQMSRGAFCNGAGWYPTSSIEYKKDVAPLSSDEAVTLFAGLSPVTFRYKDLDDKPEVGFIAEQMPDLVGTIDKRSLSITGIVAILTRVVQHQQQVISELKADVARLYDLKGEELCMNQQSTSGSS